MDSGNKNSSHSHFPAKPGDVDPIHAFEKDVPLHHIGRPQQQMQQQDDGPQKPAQQGDGHFVRDGNVGGFG